MCAICGKKFNPKQPEGEPAVLINLEPVANQAHPQAFAPSPSRIPGQTSADELLQLDIITHIAFLEGFAGIEGFQGRVLNTRKLATSRELIPEKARDILDLSTNAAAERGRAQTGWAREEWLVDRNGKNIYYEIIMVQGLSDATDIVAGLVQDAPFSR